MTATDFEFVYINSLPPPKKKTWRRLVIFLISLAVIFFSIDLAAASWYVYKINTSKSPIKSIQSSLVTANPVAIFAKSTPAPTNNLDEVKNSIATVVNLYPDLNLGVSFINIKDGKRTDIGGNQIFEGGSTTKVLIAALLLSQVEQGKHTLDQPLDGSTAGERMQQMINRSDNDAWVSLMNFIGFKYQKPFEKSLGISSYDEVTNKFDSNDMALLLYKLYSGQLLNPANTKLLLSYMQKTNNEELIPKAVPVGVTVYHKYGKYDNALHDGAIIDDGHSPFVLVIFTDLKDTTKPDSYAQRVAVFHEIVQAVDYAVASPSAKLK